MDTLTDLAPGKTAVVTELRFGDADAVRLMEFGFVPGVSVSCQRRVPMGDLSVYQVDGFQITLRRETASRIVVRKRAEAGGPDDV